MGYIGPYYDLPKALFYLIKRDYGIPLGHKKLYTGLISSSNPGEEYIRGDAIPISMPLASEAQGPCN